MSEPVVQDEHLETLWEIAIVVDAEYYRRDSALPCPFCKKQFMHTRECIVTKAHELVEARKKGGGQ